MSWYGIITVLHIVSAAVGVGAAATSDSVFLASIRNRRVSHDQFLLIRKSSNVVLWGLGILVLTGIALLILNVAIWEMAHFQAKMTAVIILMINGIIFHAKVIPLLGEHQDTTLSEEFISSKQWLLAITGTISAVSWFTALIFMLMGHLEISYLVYMAVFLILLIGGSVVAYFVMTHLIFKTKEKAEQKSKSKKANVSIILLIIMLILVVIALVMAILRPAQIHIVRIIEEPPFFQPDVLRVKPGDRIVWAHDVGHHDVPSTHPVHLVEGPRFFTSGMRPVGKTEDGWEFSFVVGEEGIYEYVCPTHPYMRGIIAVGVEPEEDEIWPPDEKVPEHLIGPPEIPGVGEIWINVQFEVVPGQPFPGTIRIMNAETWELTDLITHQSFNNPHNLRSTYDGQSFFQTQWHSETINKIDIKSRQVVGTEEITGLPILDDFIARFPDRVGTAPAHVFVDPYREQFYLTLNNDARVMILDYDLNIIGNIRTSFGAHGIWVDPSGRWMTVAATLDEKFDIIDMEKMEVVATFDAPGLPLATEITHDGRYAMISLLLEHKVRFIDLETMEHVKDVDVGKQPVWPRAAPDGKHVYVPNTESADVSIISLETLEVVKTVPAANGAHGITFGPNAAGGYYGYVTNKYARYITVIDAERQETVGNIRLPDTAWGGQGIYVLPDNEYNLFLKTRRAERTE